MSSNPSSLSLYNLSIEGLQIRELLEASEGELTPEIIERVKEMAARRLTQDEIALEIGASRSGIQRWMRINGIPAMTPVEARVTRAARMQESG